MWIRKGLYYWSEASATIGGLTYSARFQLFFLSYWLIRWCHGPEQLWKQSVQAYLNKELNVGLFTNPFSNS